jgi:hypothetical protein
MAGTVAATVPTVAPEVQAAEGAERERFNIRKPRKQGVR